MNTWTRPGLSRQEQIRAFILGQIAKEGGAYITPEENRQPDPALRIASIRCGEITALGTTEEIAQGDFMRQFIKRAVGAPVQVAP